MKYHVKLVGFSEENLPCLVNVWHQPKKSHPRSDQGNFSAKSSENKNLSFSPLIRSGLRTSHPAALKGIWWSFYSLVIAIGKLFFFYITFTGTFNHQTPSSKAQYKWGEYMMPKSQLEHESTGVLPDLIDSCSLTAKYLALQVKVPVDSTRQRRNESEIVSISTKMLWVL